MKGPLPRSHAQQQRLLDDVYENLARADPRNIDKIAITVLENLPSLLDSLLKANYESQISFSSSKKLSSSYLPDTYGSKDPQVSEEQRIYDLMTPSRTHSIFHFALGASRTRVPEPRLDYIYLPPHISFTLQVPEGETLRRQIFSLLRSKVQPSSKSNQLCVTHFEYLIFRFLSFLYVLQPNDACILKSSMLGRTGFRNVGHLLLNEYMVYFRHTGELAGPDALAAQSGTRLMYTLAEEYLLMPAVYLDPAVALPRTVKAGLLSCISPNLLAVRLPHSVRHRSLPPPCQGILQ